MRENSKSISILNNGYVSFRFFIPFPVWAPIGDGPQLVMGQGEWISSRPGWSVTGSNYGNGLPATRYKANIWGHGVQITADLKGSLITIVPQCICYMFMTRLVIICYSTDVSSSIYVSLLNQLRNFKKKTTVWIDWLHITNDEYIRNREENFRHKKLTNKPTTTKKKLKEESKNRLDGIT